ncbi:putative short-chain dehydrogenase [Aspergillus mulundensis]|uniref:NAD(P)-binding protein n=1 Tax=Aspergillus mulundensis TaxID=1810919 RepID=A0A3D8RR61_9EURO|nr:Uncharacterized protein DSM5745_06430 [Aspergillus mulundensis]RDW76438.1 Uncharacterized protein DSM5745_06430 [Aspergillus mulundensis]
MGSIYSQLFVKLSLPDSSTIKNKTILVTGSNTGLGLEAARHALNLGAGIVILAVRSVLKSEEAKTDITRADPDLMERVLVWPLDLESFASVRAFISRAREYVSNGGRLDGVILNAGIASLAWRVTEDGWERSLQVNVLSTALLALGLLPLLLQASSKDPDSNLSKPHLTILASDIHKTAMFNERHAENILSVLNDKDQWGKSQQAGGATERYAVTKLLDIYITQEIAKLVPLSEDGEPRVVVNCVAPGFCKSNLLSREEGVPVVVKMLQWAVGRSVVEGSKTLIYAVGMGSESHGCWVEDQVVRE